MAVFGESNTALEGIRAVLVKAFKDIGENVRAELVKQFRLGAKSRFDRWIEMFKDPSQKGQIDDYRQRHRPFRWWEGYVSYKKDVPYSVDDWESARKHLTSIKVSYTEADKNANIAYEDARDSFIEKNIGKLREILGKRTDVQHADIQFRYSQGVFAGTMDIRLSDASIKGELSLKYVVRHIPKTTPYFQYPLVFTGATVKGKHLARPSEEQLRNLLSGKTSEQHEQERQAAKLASGVCPGSGKSVSREVWAKIYNRMSKYATCPDCGQGASVSRSGNFLQHKTKAAVKASAASKLTEAGYCPMSKEKVPAEILAKVGPVEGYKDPKILCPGCNQLVRCDAESEWIRDRFLTDQGYPTKEMVKSARYYKHKISK